VYASPESLYIERWKPERKVHAGNVSDLFHALQFSLTREKKQTIIIGMTPQARAERAVPTSPMNASLTDLLTMRERVEKEIHQAEEETKKIHLYVIRPRRRRKCFFDPAHVVEKGIPTLAQKVPAVVTPKGFTVLSEKAICRMCSLKLLDDLGLSKLKTPGLYNKLQLEP